MYIKKATTTWGNTWKASKTLGKYNKVLGTMSKSARNTMVFVGDGGRNGYSIIKSAVNVGVKATDELYERMTTTGKIHTESLGLIEETMPHDNGQWVQSQYVKLEHQIVRTPLKRLYEQWSQNLNEYILYNIFGRFVIVDKAKKHIENQTYSSKDEKKFSILSFIYIQTTEIAKYIERSNAWLLDYLNREDEDWLSNKVDPFISKRKQSPQSLGRYFSHLNSILTTLLRNTNNVKQTVSAIHSVIKLDNTPTKDFFLEKIGDIKNINPWNLLRSVNDIGTKIVPGVIKGRQRKAALDQYESCIEKYDFLRTSIIPPQIRETQRHNSKALASIIERDFEYIGKEYSENENIKRGLWRRYLELQVLKHNRISFSQMPSLTYADIINDVFSLSKSLSDDTH